MKTKTQLLKANEQVLVKHQVDISVIIGNEHSYLLQIEAKLVNFCEITYNSIFTAISPSVGISI